MILSVDDVAFLKTIGIQKDPKKQNTPALLWPVAPQQARFTGGISLAETGACKFPQRFPKPPKIGIWPKKIPSSPENSGRDEEIGHFFWTK